MLGLSGWRMSPGTPEGGLSMRRTARESVDLGRRRIEGTRRRPPRATRLRRRPIFPSIHSCSSLLSVARLDAGR